MEDWKYHIAGRGRPLLILSGSLGATRGVALYIGEQLTGCRVIMPEYAPVQSTNQCLDALDRILAQEGINRLAVLGGSFGGLLAQAYARRHPDRVTHLILSGTSLPDPSRVRRNERALRKMPMIPLWFTRSALRVLLYGMLRKVNDPVWKREYSSLISRLSKADILSRYQVAIDFDRNYKFDSKDLPDSIEVFILEGEKDRIANQKVRDQLRVIYPGAQFHVFKGAGHSAMMTHTKEWVEVVQGFLTAKAQRRSSD